MKKISENSAIVYKNVIGAFLIKGFALLLSLLTTPAYIRFFNNNTVLGIWFTLLSVLSWILSFDLGVGNGLRNKLTQALTANDDLKIRRLISAAYISIGGFALIIFLLFIGVSFFADWNVVFNIETDIVARDTLRITIIIAFAGIMLQFFFKIINSILYALQKSSINNLLSLITSVLIFCYVSFVPGYDSDFNLIIMAVIHSLAVIAPLLVATIIVFFGKLKRFKPSVSYCDRESIKSIMSLGGIFFGLQILYMIIISTNDYLITLFVNPNSVVEYQIYYRFFSFGSTAFTLALTPIWSVVTKAIYEKNIDWTKKLYKKLILLALLSSCLEFCITIVLQLAINIFYAENAITVDYFYSICFSLMGSLMIFNAALSSITNGMGKLRCQTISFIIGALLKIPLSYLFITIFDSWIGVVISTCVVLLIYCVNEPFYIKRCFNNLLGDQKIKTIQ